LYCADCAYRPNSTIEVDTPIKTPSGMRNPARLVSKPTTTTTAMTPIPLPITIGSARGSDLRIIPATMPICLSRPGVGWSAVAPLDVRVVFVGDDAPRRGIFTMAVRIAPVRIAPVRRGDRLGRTT